MYSVKVCWSDCYILFFFLCVCISFRGILGVRNKEAAYMACRRRFVVYSLTLH